MFPNTPCPNCPPCPTEITPLPIPDLSDILCNTTYDSSCVIYTGPSIPCAGILSNVNLTTIIQQLTAKACNCCDNVPVKVYQPARLMVRKRGDAGYDNLQPACDLDYYILVYIYRPTGVISNTLSVNDIVYMSDKTTLCNISNGIYYIGIQLLSDLSTIYTTLISTSGVITYLQQCLPVSQISYRGTKHVGDPLFPTGGSVVYKNEINQTITQSNIFDNACSIINASSVVNTTNVSSGCTPVYAMSYRVVAGSPDSLSITYIDADNNTVSVTKTNTSLVNNKIYTFMMKSIVTPPVYNVHVHNYSPHVTDAFNCKKYEFQIGPTKKDVQWEYIDNSGTLVTGTTSGTTSTTEDFDTASTPSSTTIMPATWVNVTGTWAIFNNGLGITTNQNWQPSTLYAFTGTRSAWVPRSAANVGDTIKHYLATPAFIVPANGVLRFYVRRQYAPTDNTMLKIKVGLASGAQNVESTFTIDLATYSENLTFNDACLSYDPITNPTALHTNWVQKYVDLSSFAGMNIYIAFVKEHYQTSPGLVNGGNGIFIDNVQIGVAPVGPIVMSTNKYFMYSETIHPSNNIATMDNLVSDIGYCP